ncbi:MAG: hypothetical protein OXT74_08605 [Candidatus Poribacteria bacterium]|nr:hypothetical protein [Candidatus Poribacteria bacterium]
MSNLSKILESNRTHPLNEAANRHLERLERERRISPHTMQYAGLRVLTLASWGLRNLPRYEWTAALNDQLNELRGWKPNQVMKYLDASQLQGCLNKSKTPDKAAWLVIEQIRLKLTEESPKTH